MNLPFSKKIKRTAKTRFLFFLIVDVVLIIFSVFLAFLLRFDGRIPSQYINGTLPVIIGLT